ncbi:MAG TPA: septum site-determining protein Ssd [Streptosporangiaceae bacterium]|nr:septum site-determining protein Ssd [Streptosporangiaceae bacterium]
MAPAALIATGDPLLLDDLLRLAAAADAEIEVARDADATAEAWPGPPLVLVCHDLAGELAARVPPRRPGVVVVVRDEDDESVFRAAVGLGAEHVVALPGAEGWLVDTLAAATEPPGPRACSVCVVGGRGGAGASVFATMLGLTAARAGLRTLLVDGDPYGGGLDLLLGLEGAHGTRWPELTGRTGRLSPAALYGSLPQAGELSVLSWDRGTTESIPVEAMRCVLDAAGRAFALVVVDLPRGLDDAAAEAVLTSSVVLLVVPAEVRATVAADRVAAALRRRAADVRAVVAGPAPGGLDPGTVAGALGLPLAGELPRDRRLARAVEHGDLPGLRRRTHVTDLCDRLLVDLGLFDRQYREESA